MTVPDSAPSHDVQHSASYELDRSGAGPEGGSVYPLDAALSRWMAERGAPNGTALRAAVLLLSMAQRDGHTALALTDLGEQERTDALEAVGIPMPPLPELRDGLQASRLTGGPDDHTPLVLDGDRLSFRRFHSGERLIVDAVLRRLHPVEPPALPGVAGRSIARLFGGSTSDGVNWQAVAAAAALRTRFACIAGGPGTGKTTTVTRLIVLLLTLDPDLRIALAAPTGKAANRMAESVRAQLSDLDLTPAVRKGIPTKATTLHRLLGYRPAQARFTYGRDRRLEGDVVIVDEASMIDHELFTSLIRALHDDARLVLLGDPHQLPSVEAGSVFGDLCRAGAGAHKSPDFAAFLADLGLEQRPPVDPAAPPIRDAVITLTRGYRFGPDAGIGLLAGALREGRSRDAVNVLSSGEHKDLHLVPHHEQKRVVRRAVRTFASALVGASSPAEALDVLDRLRVLSPLRIGPRGVEALNKELEAWLLEERVRPRGHHYQGKPILIEKNDYDVSLFNGDVGVLWERDGHFVACFPESAGIREIPVLRLPHHEVAWAMTVHKAQGSEFDDVVLVLPDMEEAGRLTREILYTAVTRARASVTIVGSADVVASIGDRRERRVTGLGPMLATTVH